MTMQIKQKPIGSVLFQYDTYPEKIESYGKVKKVHTSAGVYALKETIMTQEDVDWFIHVMKRLERISFNYVIPVIPTKYGDYLLRYGDQVFYLMPWYEDHTEFRYPIEPEEVMTEEIAKLHSLTEKTQDYSEKVLEESHETLKKRWGLRRMEMERYVDQMEKNEYYSPFELTLLTHFQRTLYMASEAEKHLTSWFNGAKEKKSFRSVLCHGRPSRKHTCFDKYGTAYFFNFEKAVLDTPSRDLALMFRHFFQSRPWDEHEGRHWLQLYEKQFSLSDEEKHLFISYLVFPESIYQTVDNYMKNDQLSEFQAVTQLERKILTMNRIHRFMNSIFPKEQHE